MLSALAIPASVGAVCRTAGAREHRPPEPVFGRYLQYLHAPRATGLWHSAISRCSRTDPFAANAPQPQMTDPAI